MMRHVRVQKLLYEYLRSELDPSLREMVERHLSMCKKCAGEFGELKSAVELLKRYTTEPSNALAQGFWDAFAHQIEDSIRHGSGQRTISASMTALIESTLLLHRRALIILSGGLAAIIVLMAGVLLLRQAPQPDRHQLVEQPATDQQVPADITAERLHNYFSKSKVLLVGISNMKTNETEPLDLSAERSASRDLIREARYLRGGPIDGRSARLMGDLEKILIELANAKEENGGPSVEILRGGIRQENLLFKIRMAESMFDTTQVLQTENRY